MEVRNSLGFIALIILLGCSSAEATLLRVLHTNDLHSYFDHGPNPAKGGYENLATHMDELTALSTAQNVPVLKVDAGDFTEGHFYFKAMQGRASFEMMSLLGHEAIALGNHDWLMGIPNLIKLMEQQPNPLPVLAANIECARPQVQRILSRFVRPYIEKRYGSGPGAVRIAILGLTTPDYLYSWRLMPECTVREPLEVLDEYLPWLRRNNDYVFVLSHLGYWNDQQFAAQSAGVDLIIGGHSHTLLRTPTPVRNRAGHLVPIVQAGAHGETFGEILLDLFPGSPLEVLDYKIHEVTPRPINPESAFAAKYRELRNDIVSQYGASHLKAVIGTSEIPLQSPGRTTTPWGYFVAEAFRRTADADVGIDLERFHASQFPAGPIEREKLMRFYPRFFELDRPRGWNVWRVMVPALFIKGELEFLISAGMPFSVAGIKVDWSIVNRNGLRAVVVTGLRRMDGRAIAPTEWISVAAPEGIVRGGLLAQPLLAAVAFRDAIDTRVPIWRSIENHIRRNHFVVRSQQEGFMLMPFNADVGN